MASGMQNSAPLDASPSDVYLQPHSDDICFSLGGFAFKRHRGTLLTVFPITGYVPLVQGITAPSAESVTRTRIAEDEAFAEACGLDFRFLGIQCASILGHRPFSVDWVSQNSARIETPLLQFLLSAVGSRALNRRPWLFCPGGIGGHIDHVAIRMFVNRNYHLISRHYSIGFYEDLHYASAATERSMGISNLLNETCDRVLRRYVFPLGKDTSTKIALIHLYKSQFLALPQAIERFTPAAESPREPHEAIWSDEPME
jgi:LmbE family N-acetylglucosaminyl deacetylase